MDYTAGALAVPRDALIKASLHHLGRMSRGNSKFKPENLLDLIADKRYYILTEEMTLQFVSDWTRARVYVPEVKDCDSRTTSFCSDLSDAAEEFGWKYSPFAAMLSYTSKTLGKPHKKRMDGYHMTPFMFSRTKDGRDLTPWVIQPKRLVRPVGKPEYTIEEKWQSPQEEVRFWVMMAELT